MHYSHISSDILDLKEIYTHTLTPNPTDINKPYPFRCPRTRRTGASESTSSLSLWKSKDFTLRPTRMQFSQNVLHSIWILSRLPTLKLWCAHNKQDFWLQLACKPKAEDTARAGKNTREAEREREMEEEENLKGQPVKGCTGACGVHEPRNWHCVLEVSKPQTGSQSRSNQHN